MGEPFIGEIRMFGGSFAPAGWAMCDGQLMPISQNDAMFTLIGTTYGGDGQETFALPNLQSRIPMHAGQGPGLTNRVLAEMAGTESETLTTQQLPVHTHAFLATTEIGQNSQPTGGLYSQLSSGSLYHEPFDPTVTMNAAMLGPVGGNQPHDNMIPFLVITFIISLFGVFPQQT